MFQLEVFPAQEGDALILSWGDAKTPRRMLIDAGRGPTAKALKAHFEAKGLGKGAFELFVITHVDRDHIEGAVPLLRDKTVRPLIKQVWFNGRNDLEWAPRAKGFETFSALHGERVSAELSKHGLAWNTDWNGKPVALVDDTLPRFELEDGLVLTLLSPDLEQLKALAKPWDETVATAKPGWEAYGAEELVAVEMLAKRKFRGDTAKPNGSSIALIAEYGGKRVLLGADAHSPRLLKSLAAYGQANGGTAMTLVKAPHHGSRANVSADLVKATACGHWVFSTNGDQFNHPDDEAVARAVWFSPSSPTLYFNYDTARTAVWKRPAEPKRDFTVVYGVDGYMKIDIAAL